LVPIHAGFCEKVRVLQWDDHRYYHQCRINQTLHLISATSFLVAYVLMFVNPAASGLVGWLECLRASRSTFF